MQKKKTQKTSRNSPARKTTKKPVSKKTPAKKPTTKKLAKKATAKTTTRKPAKKVSVKKAPTKKTSDKKAKKQLGNVYWANSQKIDKTDRKTRRQYAVTKDSGKTVGVSKIRGFNDNDKNKERLYELNQKKYPLTKRSGVDKKVYTRRADNQKPLRLKDSEVFDKSPAFKLSSHDTHKVLEHTTTNRKTKIKKGR